MSRKRILFIDSDDSFIQSVASDAQMQGFEAIVTGSSTDGVERARQERPDLIVVNVELAPTNGWSVCTKLKKDDDLKDIPVILTSSLSTPDTFEKHKKLKTRADEYLLKPYGSEDLVRTAGQLVGMPDLSSLAATDEDVVVEDETLSTGDFDMAGLDDEIPVLDDEPLNDGMEASLEDLAIGGDEQLGDPLDPLASDPAAMLASTDDLGALPSEFGELSNELGTAAELPATDDFASFEDSFASLASSDDDTAASLPEVSLDSTPFAEFDVQALSTDLPIATFPEATEGEASLGSDVDLLSTSAETSFSAEDFSFDEAPLNVGADETATALSEGLSDISTSTAGADFAAEFQEAEGFGSDPLASTTDFSSTDDLNSVLSSLDDHTRVAELETRVAALEAELEGYKATENTQDQELERLRQESNKRSREIQELNDQLREREKTIAELRETESKLSAELNKARDERVRREAATKALTQKAEQISVAAKKIERELLTAREELKTVAPLKARVAEFENAQKESEKVSNDLRQQVSDLQGELESTKSELGTARTAHEAVQSQVDALGSEKDALQSQLDEAKAAAEAAQAERASLAEQLASAHERISQLTAQFESATKKAARARESLRLAVEQLQQDGE